MCPSRAPPKTRRESAAQHWSYPILATEVLTSIAKTMGALIQRVEDDKPVVIAYYSRALINAEMAYSAQEREMLGVVACATAWRHFILGAHCTVRVLTDHRSLQHVRLSKVGANRVGRWNMLLSEMDLEFSYIEGAKNHLADSLSRAVDFPPEARSRSL